MRRSTALRDVADAGRNPGVRAAARWLPWAGLALGTIKNFYDGDDLFTAVGKAGVETGMSLALGYVGANLGASGGGARVDLPRRWSAAELARAVEHRHDPRIASALPHAEEFGLAEWLAAGPQLLTAWRDAWAPGQHPRSAAIVAAAVDARRAGFHRPLSRELLERLHAPYLEQRGGTRLRPEPFEEAVEWALTPLFATSSLLIPRTDGYVAFDYLLDAADKQPILPVTLTTLLIEADPEEAASIGQAAWWSFYPEIAMQAYRHADRDRVGSLAGIDFLLDRGAGGAALELAERVVAQRLVELGTDHVDLWEARKTLAYVTGRVESPAQAYRIFQRLIAEAPETLGKGHQSVLRARVHQAEFAWLAGDLATGIAELEQLYADCIQLLGERNHTTLSIRRQCAVAHLESGDAETALRICRELFDDLPTTGSDAELRDAVRWLAGSCLTELGHHQEALAEWDRLVEESTARYGRLSGLVLNVRADRADAIGKAGQPEEAIRLLHEVITNWEDADGYPDRTLLLHKKSLACWEGVAGRPAQAASQLRELVAVMEQALGRDSPEVFSCQLRLAHWTAKAGRLDEAVQEREKLLAHPWTVRNPKCHAVLGLRAEFAQSVGEAGDPARAVDMLRAVVADRASVSRSPDLDLLCWRRDLAIWEGEAGDPDTAASQLRELAATSAEDRGPEDGCTLGLIWRMADWTVRAGRVEQGIAELNAALVQALRALGTNDEITRSHIGVAAPLDRPT